MCKTGKIKRAILLALLLPVVLSGQNMNKAGPAADYHEMRVIDEISGINEPAAQKKVMIITGEGSRELTSGAVIVKDILSEAGIDINENHIVTPALEEAVSDIIKIVSIEKKKITEDRKIDFVTENTIDPDLLIGQQRVIQKGIYGLEKSIYEVVFEDGQEVDRKFVETELIREPIKQIVAVGARQTASRGGKNIQFERVITMTATAYTHTGNMTYTDVWPSLGTIAVDPSVIPLGSRLYIEGYGFGTALDTGGYIKGNRIDLFFDTKAEALKWGRRKVEVFVLK